MNPLFERIFNREMLERGGAALNPQTVLKPVDMDIINIRLCAAEYIKRMVTFCTFPVLLLSQRRPMAPLFPTPISMVRFSNEFIMLTFEPF